jgi:hypothetical protein
MWDEALDRLSDADKQRLDIHQLDTRAILDLAPDNA